jgi:hypothetical protein
VLKALLKQFSLLQFQYIISETGSLYFLIFFLYNIYIFNTAYKLLFGKPMHRWGDSIKMKLKRNGAKMWIHLLQDRVLWWAVLNMVTTLRFHKRRNISTE